MSDPRENRTITVRATSEMANWMHPQNDYRKQMIQKRIEAAKERYSKSKKIDIVQTSDSLPTRVKIKVGHNRFSVSVQEPGSGVFRSAHFKSLKKPENISNIQLGGYVERKRGRN